MSNLYKNLVEDCRSFVNLVEREPGSKKVLDSLVSIEKGIRNAVNNNLTLDNSHSVDNRLIDEILYWLLSSFNEDRSCEIKGLRNGMNVDQLDSDNTIYDLLTFVNDKMSMVLNSGVSILMMLEKLNISHQEVLRPILPPDDLDPPSTEKRNDHVEKVLTANKFTLFLEFLRNKNICTDDLHVTIGKNDPSMMRKTSYLQIEIPKLRKIVLLNQDYGQASFVVEMSENYSIWDVMNAKKSELINEFGAVKITFMNKNIDQWHTDLNQALFGTSCEPITDVDLEGYVKNRNKMNLEYFTIENVRMDLEGFSEECGVTIDELCLTFLDRNISCSNGKSVSFGTYLNRAGSIIGINTSRAAAKMHVEILKALKKMIGYEMEDYSPMDLNYFNNVANVKADLESFASICGVSVNDLLLTHDVAICSNGESLRLRTYVTRAGILFGYESKQDKISARVTTMKKLKRLVGYEVKDYSPMNLAYFKNVENVKADLRAFALNIDENGSIDALWVSSDCEATCSNGEVVSFGKYIIRAGILKGLKTGEVTKKSEIFDELKSIVGINVQSFSIMDADYFRNVEFVRADLQAFATAAGIEVSRLKVTAKYNHLEVVCSNGESVKWPTYTGRAGVLKGLSSKEARFQQASLIDELKRIAGVEGVKVFSMNLAYFQNSDNVQADLKAFSDAVGVDTASLYLVHKIRNVKVICANGERISFRSYLGRAGLLLDLNCSQANLREPEILDELKRILGINLVRYHIMDENYFTKENVLNDLSAFAKAGGVEIADISTHPKYRELEITCANGQKINWRTYVMRAGSLLGLKTRDSQNISSKIIDKLKEIVGINIVKYSDMDINYFNPENVSHDIQAFALEGCVDASSLKMSPNFRRLEATCSNGEKLTWRAYIGRARILLGIASADIPGKEYEIINELRRRGGEFIQE